MSISNTGQSTNQGLELALDMYFMNIFNITLTAETHLNVNFYMVIQLWDGKVYVVFMQ